MQPQIGGDLNCVTMPAFICHILQMCGRERSCCSNHPCYADVIIQTAVDKMHSHKNLGQSSSGIK